LIPYLQLKLHIGAQYEKLHIQNLVVWNDGILYIYNFIGITRLNYKARYILNLNYDRNDRIGFSLNISYGCDWGGTHYALNTLDVPPKPPPPLKSPPLKSPPPP